MLERADSARRHSSRSSLSLMSMQCGQRVAHICPMSSIGRFSIMAVWHSLCISGGLAGRAMG